METVASVIGLVAVAAKVYTALQTFLSSCADAPSIARTTCDEVRDFKYAIQKLQPYVNQSSQITPLGAAITDVSQLSLTLGSCVVTFSQLEKTLDRLLSRNRMDTIDRVRWTLEGGRISQLVSRIQQHKMTLILLLNIWMSESSTEAEQCWDQLNDTLTVITDLLQQPSQRPVLRTAIDPSGPPTSTVVALVPMNLWADPTSSDTAPVRTRPDGLQSSQSAFRSALFASKPYKGINEASTSVISLRSSQRFGTRWSLYSGGSNTSVFSLPFTTSFELSGNTIAEVSDLSTIPLPVSNNMLYNPWWYSESGLDTTNSRESQQGGIGLPVAPLERQDFLFAAVAKGNMIIVLRELSNGADPNSWGLDISGSTQTTALHMAIKVNHEAIVKVLVSRGAYLHISDSDYLTPFQLAAKLASGAIVEFLIESGGVDNTSLQFALSISIRSGNEDAISVLLDRGADIEYRSTAGATPLLQAVWAGQESVVRLLLDRGAYTESTSLTGRAPLHEAVWDGHLEITKLLLDGGAEIENRLPDGRTPLYEAVLGGHEDIIKLLLDRGAIVGIKRSNGETLLGEAMTHTYPWRAEGAVDPLMIVELLMTRGGHYSSRVTDYKTPSDAVEDNDHKDVTKSFLEREFKDDNEISGGS